MNMQWLHAPEENIVNPLAELNYWANLRFLQGKQTQVLMQQAANDQQKLYISIVALCQLSDVELKPLINSLGEEALSLLKYRGQLRQQYHLL